MYVIVGMNLSFTFGPQHLIGTHHRKKCSSQFQHATSVKVKYQYL